MTRARRRIVVALAAAAAIAAPFFLKPYGIFLISTWAVLTIAAIGLNLTLGYAGQISLAQGAFVGIGAYTVALSDAAGRAVFRRVYCRRPPVLRNRVGAWLPGAARAAPLPRLRHACFHHSRFSRAAQRAMADERHLRHHWHAAPDIARVEDERRARFLFSLSRRPCDSFARNLVDASVAMGPRLCRLARKSDPCAFARS